MYGQLKELLTEEDYWIVDYVKSMDSLLKPEEFDVLVLPELANPSSDYVLSIWDCLFPNITRKKYLVECTLGSQYTTDVVTAIQATSDVKPYERKIALRKLCPCRVKKDIDVFWDRVFEMIHDPEPDVRYQALHNICDGSPAYLEDRVIEAVQSLQGDQSNKVRRVVSKVLLHYRKTGKWNIL